MRFKDRVCDTRRSGRTTRTIELALSLAREGGDVLYVVHTSAMVDYAWGIVAARAELDGNGIQTRFGRVKANLADGLGTIGVVRGVVMGGGVTDRYDGYHVVLDHVVRGEW